jgi:hypothetical protein
VYFGTTSPGTFQGNQPGTTFDAGTMAENTTYYWRIDEKNAGGITTGDVWSFTTGSVVVSHWKLDEGSGTTAYDSSGGNDGTLVNGPVWTTGQIGGALNFDGMNDYINLGNSSSLKLPLPVTISAWIRLNTTGLVQKIMCIDSQSTVTYYGIWFFVQSNNKLMINYGDGRGGDGPAYRRSKVGTTALASGSWYHVVAVLQGPTDMTLYINGVDDGGTYSGSGTSLAYSAATSLIGCGNSSDGYLNGIIDDVRFYDRALSDEEIEQLYEGGLD